MKISYTYTASISYVVLFDEAAGDSALADFPPTFGQVVQREPLAGGTREFREIRGNGSCAFPVDFIKAGYATRAASLASIRAMRTVSQSKVHLKVEEGSEVQYYPNATATGYAGQVQGQSCRHAFQFISDDVTTTAPT